MRLALKLQQSHRRGTRVYQTNKNGIREGNGNRDLVQGITRGELKSINGADEAAVTSDDAWVIGAERIEDFSVLGGRFGLYLLEA